jgi:two-component system, NarL family, sensor histidine kinase UhpB
LKDIGLREAITELVDNLNIAQKVQLKLKSSGVRKAEIAGNIKLMAYRIIQEQLNNILKHARATEAEIKLVVSEKMLNITVADNGVGFDPRKKAKGIGLNNIASRAELHNGRVEIISAPGKGCTLKVAIPI